MEDAKAFQQAVESKAPDLDNDTIKRISLEINGSLLPVDKRVPVYKHKYAEFAEKYPALFRMSCNGAINEHILDMLLSQRSTIDDDEKSKHNASVNVGQFLFDSFVKEKISS